MFNIGLAKKFIWVFPQDYIEKAQQTFWATKYIRLLSPPLKCQLLEGRDFCLSYSLLCLYHLKQCLAHSGCSVNICRVN